MSTLPKLIKHDQITVAPQAQILLEMTRDQLLRLRQARIMEVEVYDEVLGLGAHKKSSVKTLASEKETG